MNEWDSRIMQCEKKCKNNVLYKIPVQYSIRHENSI